MQKNEGWSKFNKIDEQYFNYIEQLEKKNYDTKDLIYNFPVFVGQVNLARHLFFYDLYKEIKDLAGDIADIGTYKGASFLFWAKLLKMFEPLNTTQVHGFDWFEGMNPGQNDLQSHKGDYISDYKTLLEIIKLQGLDDVAVLHKLDLTKDLDQFMSKRPYSRYKMVFIDCGIENVLEEAIKHFWQRLVKGGIMILDHYNNSSSPKESHIVEKYIGDNYIRQISYVRQPTAYVIKEK